MPVDDLEIFKSVKGRVAKFCILFENEIKRNHEWSQQQKLILRRTARKEPFRPSARAPTKISSKLAALIGIFERDEATLFAFRNNENTRSGAKTGEAQVFHLGRGAQAQLNSFETVEPMIFRKGAEITSGVKGEKFQASSSQAQWIDGSGKAISGKAVIIGPNGEPMIDMDLLAEKLTSENALYKATVLYDYNGVDATEIGVLQDAQVEVFEVTPEGWALIKDNGKLGWVPLSVLRPNASEGSLKYNEFGEDIKVNALCPDMQLRQIVLNFVAASTLFSEIRALREMDVFIDDIDELLKEGRTVPGTMASLLFLEDEKRKFDDFQQLAQAVKEIRALWDSDVAQALELLEKHGSSLIERAPSAYEKIYVDRILMESTSGGHGLVYLRKIIGEGKKVSDDEELIKIIGKLHSEFREAKEKKHEGIKRMLMSELSNPEIKVFKEGFIDLDMKSLEQMLVKGFEGEELIEKIRHYNSKGVKFSTFGKLMAAIYEAKFNEKAPTLISREHVKKNISLMDDENVEIEELSIPEKVDLIMRTVGNPNCVLFQGTKSNIRVKVEDLQKLITENRLVSTILTDLVFLSFLDRHFESFDSIRIAQRDSQLLQLKALVTKKFKELKILHGIHEYVNTDVDKAFANTLCFMNPIRILENADIQQGAPYKDHNSLARAIARAAQTMESSRKQDQDLIVSFMEKNPLFTTEVKIYLRHINSMLDIMGSGPTSINALQNFLKNGKKFNSFEDLLKALREDALPSRR